MRHLEDKARQATREQDLKNRVAEINRRRSLLDNGDLDLSRDLRDIMQEKPGQDIEQQIQSLDRLKDKAFEGQDGTKRKDKMKSYAQILKEQKIQEYNERTKRYRKMKNELEYGSPGRNKDRELRSRHSSILSNRSLRSIASSVGHIQLDTEQSKDSKKRRAMRRQSSTVSDIMSKISRKDL